MAGLAAALLTFSAAGSLALVAQTGVALAPNTTEAAAACACLNWHEVYAQHGVTCGQGLELVIGDQREAGAEGGRLADVNVELPSKTPQEYLAKDPESARGRSAIRKAEEAGLDGEMCGLFFSKLETTDCVKVTQNSADQWHGKSWCYVDAACHWPFLNGGDKLTPEYDVGVKICEENPQLQAQFGTAGDSILASKSPQELMAWRRFSGLSMAVDDTLVKMAYPYVGENFEEVLPFFLGKDCPIALQERCDALASLQSKLSGRAFVADMRDRSSEKIVVYGKQVWNFSKNTCLHNCEEN